LNISSFQSHQEDLIVGIDLFDQIDFEVISGVFSILISNQATQRSHRSTVFSLLRDFKEEVIALHLDFRMIVTSDGHLDLEFKAILVRSNDTSILTTYPFSFEFQVVRPIGHHLELTDLCRVFISRTRIISNIHVDSRT
jgi:hypothetical protein